MYIFALSFAESLCKKGQTCKFTVDIAKWLMYSSNIINMYLNVPEKLQIKVLDNKTFPTYFFFLS
jgi:hypothetical protein